MRRMLEEFPKCPICGSATGYESSGIMTKYARCPVCMTKWMLSVKKGEILELTLHELPKDGSSVNTIASTKAPLFTITGKCLSTDFWKNLKLAKEINWKFLSKNVSSEASEAIFKEKEEKLLYQWKGDREVSNEDLDIIVGRTGVINGLRRVYSCCQLKNCVG